MRRKVGEGRDDPGGTTGRAAESALVRACQRGDVAAFAQLVRAYQDLVLRTAYLLVDDPHAAEDVAQNTFLAVFRGLHRFDPERPFRPWLLGIATKEARHYRRGLRRHPAGALDARLPAGTDPLPDQAIRDDERARVRDALAALDEPFRTTAILYYVDELPVEVIAGAQGCRAGTVKSRLHTARHRLRALLAPAVEVVDAPPEPPARDAHATHDSGTVRS